MLVRDASHQNTPYSPPCPFVDGATTGSTLAVLDGLPNQRIAAAPMAAPVMMLAVLAAEGAGTVRRAGICWRRARGGGGAVLGDARLVGQDDRAHHVACEDARDPDATRHVCRGAP